MWIAVKQITLEGKQIDNIANIDTIVRVGPRGSGSYIKFLDGNSIDVTDSFQEIAEILLKAEGKLHMEYSITDQNIIVCHGGHKQRGLGHCRTYPIFKDDATGTEMISLNGQVLQPLANLSFEISRRETVKRGE
jgi:hypothetical protein